MLSKDMLLEGIPPINALAPPIPAGAEAALPFLGLAFLLALLRAARHTDLAALRAGLATAHLAEQSCTKCRADEA